MRLLLISVIQSVLLCGGQVLLKLAMQRAGAFSWSLDFLTRNLTNWWLLACGICYGAATLLWLYIIHEEVPLVRWIGVLLIMSGCVLIAK